MRPDIQESVTTGSAAIEAVGQSLDRKADRRDVYRIAAVAAAVAASVAVLISVPVAIAGGRQLAAQDLRQDAIEQRQQEDRDRADAAYTAAQEANEELARRGQPRVNVPRPTEDPKAIQDTLVAAAVAGTLAELPELVQPPTVQQMATAAGAAVARYMAANPLPGVTPEQVAGQVASYLRANPPAAGPEGKSGTPGDVGATGPTGPPPQCMSEPTQCRGERGETGPAPTAEQIMAAFAVEVGKNPSLLCAGEGTFVKLEGVLVASDSAIPRTQDIWTCIPPSGE